MSVKSFVAINFIECSEDYRERFETLFGSRAHAIDQMPGFRHMQVLKPNDGSNTYLVVSHWDSEDSFSQWTKSPAFEAGHKRAFEDMARARQEGRAVPMTSKFKTYSVIAQ